MPHTELRTVYADGITLTYALEYKTVKNLNLHVRKDCSVYVSANEQVTAETVDSFVLSKKDFIFDAQKKFRDQEQYRPQPKQYISGETFFLQGKSLRLKVVAANRNRLYTDGVHLFLETTAPQDYSQKEKLVRHFFEKQCRDIFGEIAENYYPIFQKYGVAPPVLRIRNMETRWGSCLPTKGIITLNKRLLEAPRNCIEYVVVHEFCHFIHPNHSKHFYEFLTMVMPDWKNRKQILDSNAAYYL